MAAEDCSNELMFGKTLIRHMEMKAKIVILFH